MLLTQIIKLAETHPEIQHHFIPLIKSAAGENRTWEKFLELKYEGGKKMVPNPNHSNYFQREVQLDTALKDPTFKNKIHREYLAWLSTLEDTDSKQLFDESVGKYFNFYVVPKMHKAEIAAAVKPLGLKPKGTLPTEYITSFVRLEGGGKPIQLGFNDEKPQAKGGYGLSFLDHTRKKHVQQGVLTGNPNQDYQGFLATLTALLRQALETKKKPTPTKTTKKPPMVQGGKGYRRS